MLPLQLLESSFLTKSKSVDKVCSYSMVYCLCPSTGYCLWHIACHWDAVQGIAGEFCGILCGGSAPGPCAVLCGQPPDQGHVDRAQCWEYHKGEKTCMTAERGAGVLRGRTREYFNLHLLMQAVALTVILITINWKKQSDLVLAEHVIVSRDYCHFLCRQ